MSYIVTTDKKLLHVIGEGETKEQAIKDATEFLESKSLNQEEYGEFEDYFYLSDDDCKREDIVIRWSVEEDAYDGGRDDYYGSRL
jgi:hypothetical protein